MTSIRLIATWICLVVVAALSSGCQTAEPAGPRYTPKMVWVSRAQYDNAVVAYTKAIERNPKDADAYFKRGFAHSIAGYHQLAERDYTKTIELQPDHFVAYENRGTAQYRLGHFNEAIQDYDKAIQLQPNDGIAHENRAWAYYHLKDYDKAWADIAVCKQVGRTPEPSLTNALAKASGRSN